MNRYEIRCTEEQTRKAFALGAPIETSPMIDLLRNEIGNSCLLIGSNVYWFPTAEQLIGWLEGEGYIEDIVVYKNWKNLRFDWTYDVICCSIEGSLHGGVYYSRKEATIAAIDAALECLEKTKRRK